jgi:plasmid replication initiation protein
MKQKMQIESLKNELVVHHNYLIEARYNLSRQEKRLMYWLSSQTKKEDEDFKEHELSIKSFATLIDVRGDHLYKELHLIAKRLMQSIITIRSLDDKSWTMAALLSGAKYDDKKGVLKLSFHPYLKPYMLQLRDKFTKVNLGDIFSLKSVYSIRVYELLKQYESVGNRKISLEDLRSFCGISQTQYKKYNDFKRFVLETAKNEINAKTDVFIDYQESKRSRKIVAIVWTVRNRDNVEAIPLMNSHANHLHAKLEKIGVRPIKAKSLLNTYGTEVVELAIEELGNHPKISKKGNYLEGILKTWEKSKNLTNNNSFSTEPPLTLTFHGKFSVYKKSLADKIGHPAYKSWFIDNGVEFVLQESGIFPTFSSQRVADHIFLNYQNSMDKTWEETKDIYTGNV